MYLTTDGTAPTFDPRRPFRRRLLHETYGGQQRGGISTPQAHPFIFLFTGDTGEQYGYRDEWLPDGTFRYTGEGQIGDMQMVRGNAAIRDHAANGKDLYLFAKTAKSHVAYLGQMVCTGYETVVNIPDRNGTARTVIVFYLRPIDSLADQQLEPEQREDEATERLGAQDVWDVPLEQLREQALAAPLKNAPPDQARRNVYKRSAAVRTYVLRRAAGMCEGCGAPAPFHTSTGRPYLEPHHTRRVSDGGPDHPAFVIALCPNCHRRAHYARQFQSFNAGLEAKLQRIETGQELDRRTDNRGT
jgi:5-methylcytosine-specific restriction protein A